VSERTITPVPSGWASSPALPPRACALWAQGDLKEALPHAAQKGQGLQGRDQMCSYEANADVNAAVNTLRAGLARQAAETA
jgi:hypothetical protein